MLCATPSRVLVVDDSPRNRSILHHLLEPPHIVAFAASGEEAIETAATFLPEIVLLDIMMPGIDGYETCRRLRAMAALARTKILMVSARAMSSERLAGYEAGADDYVVKPFDHDELLAKIAVFSRLCSVEETDRVKNGVLGLFNHLTRTPLTAIVTSLDLLLEDPSVPAAHRELVEIARQGAHRLTDYVERVSTLQRLTSAGANGTVEEIDLAEPARRAAGALSARASETRVGIVTALGEGLVVRCDAEQIEQVMRSLLDNAVRHSPPGGTVRLALAAENGEAQVSVTDEGPGIADDFVYRIFEGMEVPDILHHGGGLGLSLAIASAIARRHGGTLSAQNLPAGGASFLLRLPRLVAAAAARDPAGTREEAPHPPC